MSKSVSTTLDEKDYDALKALAKTQDRNISGQVRHMLRNALAIANPVSRWNPGTQVRGDAPVPPDQTNIAGAGSAPETPDIRKFTGVVVPDELLGQDDSTQPEGPHANASAKQKPLPG